MDSTASPPPYRHHSRSEPPSRTKSASRLAQSEKVPHLSLALIQSPSPPSRKSSASSLPLHELLLLSPSPNPRRSKTRLADRFDMPDEPAAEPRRRCKSSRASQMGSLGCASPRNTRRSRRRSEVESREDKDLGLGEEVVKPIRKRRSKKDKLGSVPCAPSPTSSAMDDEDGSGLDRIGQLLNDLIMWRDVARSTLWFGLGTLFFFSSCFTKGVHFSVFSAVSQLGLLFLGASFVSNSISQRNGIEKKHDFLLKESDILGVAKMILPAANLAITCTRKLFSGEPSMTLKVVPFFLLGAEYGHHITLWRLSMLAFFISFTIPRLYSCYSIQMNQKAECLKWRVLEAWGACSHKKIVAASAATAFWNLSSVKTRIFTAFISLVILRYCRQHMVQVRETDAEPEEEEQQQAMVVAEAEGKQEQPPEQALVVAEVSKQS
ncbi:PREDICTED: reticulon-like protein B17 [Fragaria vesca subsp. vesca]|uniref:reticulon-like protein B17 n=1 Tax=Fragaria vesca subsp. vesca TaxID=101020 RepID=UPI0002C327B0|nr:PREDICTED: reticulon-like protein B17 [Fragaria vesca subsp. vesca]